MYSIERELEKELQTLYKLEKKIKDELKKAPKGSLRISNSHSKPEYYYKQEGDSKGNGTYIKKKDFAKAMGIPYRYEYPISLANGICVYPDFTMLKMPERKEVYLEHLGLLDDELYLQSTWRKLNSYGENGIFIGDNLLITFESSRYLLNTKMLEGVLKRMQS